MNMTIKEKLQESGRYEQIMEIVAKIAVRNFGDVPVRLQYNSEMKPVSRVKISDVRTGLNLWLLLIGKEQVSGGNVAETLFALEAYVSTELDMMLHNYANSISHRTEPEEDMEEIRAWQVFLSSIHHLMNPWDPEYGTQTDFTIPKGWRCQNGD